MNTTDTNREKQVTSRAGKYLTFGLGTEEFGLEILKVREIIGYMRTTAVPEMPHYVKGVINLRGQVIPIIDIRLKFGMEEAERTDETCIIVVNVRENMIGIVVDRVSEVLDIRHKEIEDVPEIDTEADSSFILGMAKIKDQVKILLAIDRVFTENVVVDTPAPELEAQI